ncbi:hypothetical protein A5727_19375 [Mycobacterium sp. ACS4331]|nr:hypothetical protein A5727_19375 [Mycobacterium sp. ACS4331]
MQVTSVPTRRRSGVFVAVALAILVWSAAFVYLAAAVIPVDHYLISYYIADYQFGFVRRGLAGELVGGVAGDSFFRNAYLMRWLTTGVYLAGLAALAFTLLRRVRTPGRIMLALLLPVLPFGVPYAVYSGRPDLLGATALIALCLALSVVQHRRPALICCGVFGVVVAVLALMHEGMALEFGLGAILAIMVLAKGLARWDRRWAAALAIAPGLLTALAVAAFANHDVSGRVCAQVPHRMIETPFASIKAPGDLVAYLTTDTPVLSDYHDWVCGWYLATYDHSVADGLKEVAAVGVPALIGSILLGLAGLSATLWSVARFSGVPMRPFFAELKSDILLPAFGLLLIIPLFITGVDWTRWLLVVAFDIVVVFVLYAQRRPEIDDVPPRRTLLLFPLVVLGFMLIPLGVAPGGGSTR